MFNRNSILIWIVLLPVTVLHNPQSLTKLVNKPTGFGKLLVLIKTLNNFLIYQKIKALKN